jgi:hypothetical protein
MKSKIKRIILLILITLILINLIINYKIDPIEKLKIGEIIASNSFENFESPARDCCENNKGESKISLLKSKDSILGNFSIGLVSENHCACINEPLKNFNKEDIYILKFYYKGDHPRFCSWFEGDKTCTPNKELEETDQWEQQKEILFPTEKTKGISIYFYADSDGTKTVTNYYDDLQVRKLIPITDTYNFQDNEEYIIKTKADNNVNGERISEIENGEAYFLIQGKPNVTIKFPLTELIIILIMLIIIIRLTKNEKH